MLPELSHRWMNVSLLRVWDGAKLLSGRGLEADLVICYFPLHPSKKTFLLTLHYPEHAQVKKYNLR